jgi:polysaccharide biosynthesis protein PslH
VRVLVLTHRLPYAPNRGDRIRSYHLLRILAAQHEIHLISLVHDEEEATHVGALAALGVASCRVAPVSRFRRRLAALGALAGTRPLTHVLLHSAALRPLVQHHVSDRPPDAVLATGTGMARFAFEPPLAGLPCLLDMVDVDSEKWAELGRTAALPMRAIYRREARLLRRFERVAVARAHATTVVNERERLLLDTIAPRSGAMVVPNGIDLAGFSPGGPPASAPRVVFCGVFNYGPNEDAARWLAREVWPIVRRARPAAELVLAGAHPSPAVVALSREPSIRITGAVADIRPFLWEAAVSVAPLRLSRGIQNKVLEALAAGLPCVVTPAVLDGLPQGVRAGCQTATEPEAFAAEIVSLLDLDAGTRRAIAGRADFTGLSWEAQLHPMLDLLAAMTKSVPKANGRA